MARAKRPKASAEVASGLEKAVSDLAAAVDTLARRRGLDDDDKPVRFDCGHRDTGQAVDRRTRRRGTAAWWACRACNVITLAVARWDQEEATDGPAR